MKNIFIMDLFSIKLQSLKYIKIFLPYALLLAIVISIQGCRPPNDKSRAYINGVFVNKNIQILKENVNVFVFNNSSKAKFVIDYYIHVKKSDNQVPIIWGIGSDDNDTDYKFEAKLDAKNVTVLTNPNKIITNNFSPLNNAHDKLFYILQNISQGKHHIQVIFTTNSGKALYDEDCQDMKLYRYMPSKHPKDISHINIENENIFTITKLSKSEYFDYRIAINDFSNPFSYFLYFVFFLIPLTMAYFTIKDHRQILNSNNNKQNSKFFYIFAPFFLVTIFFVMWGTFGCLGMKIILYPFALIFGYALYIDLVRKKPFFILFPIALILLISLWSYLI